MIFAGAVDELVGRGCGVRATGEELETRAGDVGSDAAREPTLIDNRGQRSEEEALASGAQEVSEGVTVLRKPVNGWFEAGEPDNLRCRLEGEVIEEVGVGHLQELLSRDQALALEEDLLELDLS